jgi:polar amino acid transport system substrate-binding protein
MPLSAIHKLTLIPFIFCLFHMPVTATAEQNNNEVVIAIGFSLEPYVFKNGNGIISDLIRETLKLSGKTSRFKLSSNAKALEQYSTHQCDGVAVVREGMVDGFLSQPYVMFQNYAISLKNQKIKLDNLSDLKPYSLIAFSNASQYLGKEFASVIKNKDDYQELDKQIDQLETFFDGKADVIIADQTIFKFYQRRLRNRYPLNKKYRQEVNFHDLFPPSIYRAAFHNKQLRDEFDMGFKQLTASGQADDIYRVYTNLLKNY